MPVVLIDGISYVPRAEVPEITDARLAQAVQKLVSIQYFREHHKAVAHAWEVLNILAPELAQLAADDPGAAYARVNPVDDASA